MLGPIMLICGFMCLLFAGDKAQRAGLAYKRRYSAWPTPVPKAELSDSVKTLRWVRRNR